jgi:hypothetical protein
MKRESRTAAIKRRLQAVRIVLVHSRYLRRQCRALGTSVGEGLRAFLRWLNRRARRQRWTQRRLWRRYAATVIEMYKRSAHRQRIYRRRVCNRPPARVRWVIEADRRAGRLCDVFPPAKSARVFLSRRARIRAWLAVAKNGGSA